MTFCFGHWLSAQATSDPTWQSDVAKLRPIQKVTDKIQPGPIRCFRWAEPINSAFLIYIFYQFLIGFMGQAQHFSIFFQAMAFYYLFLFWASAFFTHFYLIFSLNCCQYVSGLFSKAQIDQVQQPFQYFFHLDRASSFVEQTYTISTNSIQHILFQPLSAQECISSKQRIIL